VTLQAQAWRAQATAPVTHADRIVDHLEAMRVEYVFGVPGGPVEPLLDALARSQRRGGPALVVARHECGAAFMADGYHRASGRLGVVCATTGPGTTNLITGVCSAMAESVPLLVLTAQPNLPKFGRRALQESSCTGIDTVAMLRLCTRMSTLVSHEDQLQAKVVAALMAAYRGRPAPVHLSIPSDILRAAATPAGPALRLPPRTRSLVDDAGVFELAAIIARSERIAVFVERDIGAAGHAVVAFCEQLGVPFVAGQTGKYAIDERHPLYRGVFGFAGHASASTLLAAPHLDLLLVVGAPMSELSTGGWDARLCNNPKVVHIDEDEEHFARTPAAALHVLGAIEVVFDRLRELLPPRPANRAWATVHPSSHTEAPARGGSDEGRIKPQRVVEALSEHIPQDAQIYVDAGNAWAWMTHGFVHRFDGPSVHSAVEYGSMGWAVGAAIGAARAKPGILTIALVGDGAYLMSGQELTVAREQSLPIVFVVLNDGALGMVMHGQRLAGAEPIGWQLGEVDYAQQAASLGLPGVVIRTPEDLAEVDWDMLARRKGPTLLDVRIDREESPPMGQRVRDLGNGRGQ